MSKPKIRETALTALVIVLIVGVGAYLFNNKQDVPGGSISSGSNADKVATQSIDSSSCIACHTSEAVIAASDYGKDKAPAVNTGG